jgi:hypothetical protein
MADLKYTAPQVCIGDWTIQNECTENADSTTIQNYIAESIEISGAKINVFKLLGVHEQGLLTDLTGNGTPYHSGAGAGSDATNAFDISPSSWISVQLGVAVVNGSYLGYNFGYKKTSFGTNKYGKQEYVSKHITTIKIQQSANPLRRAIQARIERASGELIANEPIFVGSGNGKIINLQPGYDPHETTIHLIAVSATSFAVLNERLGPRPNLTVGQAFADEDMKFSIDTGSISFSVGDTFTISTSLIWKRSAVVNLPDTGNLETVSVTPSAPAAYWRIIPILFNGVAANEPWEVVKLELMDYEATSLDNIQDTLFLENRDRDYASSSITLKCSYQPFDSIGDAGKFGFSVMDQYVFTCSFARMVELLGRPIVVGDILEVTPEMMYDRNLLPVKKFVEVIDCGWSAEGFTPQWTPTLYRFQGSQLIPSTETRDIIKTPVEELQTVSDGDFFSKFNNQVPTSPITITEKNKVEAQDAVTETGSDVSEIAQEVPQAPAVGNNFIGQAYVEDGMPPNGLPYGEGYKLPDALTANDGDYFRLYYPDSTKIAPRLYKFSLLKGKWIYIESDRRQQYSSLKPSLRNALQSLTSKSLKSDL